MKKNAELKYNHLNMERISVSKKGIGMYAITFVVNGKKISKTAHLTEKQADTYVPSVEIVQSGHRTLGKCSFRADGKLIK